MSKRRCAHNKTPLFLHFCLRARPGRVKIVVAFLLIALFSFALFSLSFAAEPASAPSVSLSQAVPNRTPQEVVANVPQYTKETTQLVVSISVNNEPRGDFFLEINDEGALFIKVDDLVSLKLGFAQDRIVLIGNEKYVPLNALIDVRFTFDEKKLTLSFLGKTTERTRTAINLYPLQVKPENVYYPRETSAFLNYGLAYAYTDPNGLQSFTVTNKAGVRSGDIFIVSDSLYTKTKTSETFVRLQSSATYERRGDLQWFVLGDEFANSGDLGSTVNIGGVGFSKVYKLDPYFITQPIFNLKGTATLPSQADIYMDGVLVSKQMISPGSFNLNNIYSLTGAHTVDVVMKDPFGNEQRISYPLYFSTQLLREGLHEYSYNVGFLRENYGIASDEYGKAVFSAFHRYGVSNSFNIGARAEGASGLVNGGISSAFLVPRVGAFTLSLAESNLNGKGGSAGSFQHSFQIGSFSTNLLVRGYTRDYATVATTLASAPTTTSTRYELNASVGYSYPSLGGIALSYSENGAYGGVYTRATSASYAKGLSRTTSLFVTASATRVENTTYALFVGFNFNLGPALHAAAQYSKTGSTDTETVQVQQDTPVGEGLGYRASLNRSDGASGSVDSFNPFVQYNARYGTYSLDATLQNSHGDTTGSYTVSAAGSLVYAGGFFGFSRPVSDSFAIATVDSVPNVMVLNNGQEIGKTDSSGVMVIPTLTSYNQNQITLDVKNMPLDYSISDVHENISPPLWSGSCVSFDAQKVQAVTGTVFAKIDDKKVPLQFIEVSMKVGESVVTFPTGKGGEFYVENTLPEESKAAPKDKLTCRAIAERRKSGANVIKPGTYQASAYVEGGKCEFSITFPDTKDIMTDLGEVQCLMPPPAK